MKKVLGDIKTFAFDNKVYVVKAIVIFLLVIAGIFTFVNDDKDDEIEISKNHQEIGEDVELVENKSSAVIVDVSGEVKMPMVVELPSNSRIDDAINAAGGLTKKADINQINRAQIVEDGQKIFIPPKAMVGKTENTIDLDNFNQVETDKVNINSATSTELQEIPGVGPVTAQKIEDYRNQNGAFKRIDDIKNVSGIGDKTFEKMKDRICV